MTQLFLTQNEQLIKPANIADCQYNPVNNLIEGS